MSYDTRFSGEILIAPPIPAEEVLAAGFHEPGRYGDKDMAVKVVEAPVEGVPGAYRRLAVAIVPSMSRYTAYDAVEHVQEIVSRWGGRRRFLGRITAVGEEAGDIWRLEVQGGRAVRVEPRILWPDGTEGVGIR